MQRVTKPISFSIKKPVDIKTAAQTETNIAIEKMYEPGEEELNGTWTFPEIKGV